VGAGGAVANRGRTRGGHKGEGGEGGGHVTAVRRRERKREEEMLLLRRDGFDQNVGRSTNVSRSERLRPGGVLVCTRTTKHSDSKPLVLITVVEEHFRWQFS
jgi:hypothetical protein